MIAMFLAIIGWVGAFYGFIMNRKLRDIEIDKKLELLDIEQKDFLYKTNKEKTKGITRLYYIYSKFGKEIVKGKVQSYEEDIKQKIKTKLGKINAERKFLRKIKKCKWLWSKIDLQNDKKNKGGDLDVG